MSVHIADMTVLVKLAGVEMVWVLWYKVSLQLNISFLQVLYLLQEGKVLQICESRRRGLLWTVLPETVPAAKCYWALYGQLCVYMLCSYQYFVCGVQMCSLQCVLLALSNIVTITMQYTGYNQTTSFNTCRFQVFRNALLKFQVKGNHLIASFPGSHAPERKHWSCAGLVFFSHEKR